MDQLQVNHLDSSAFRARCVCTSLTCSAARCVALHYRRCCRSTVVTPVPTVGSIAVGQFPPLSVPRPATNRPHIIGTIHERISLLEMAECNKTQHSRKPNILRHVGHATMPTAMSTVGSINMSATGPSATSAILAAPAIHTAPAAIAPSPALIPAPRPGRHTRRRHPGQRIDFYHHPRRIRLRSNEYKLRTTERDIKVVIREVTRTLGLKIGGCAPDGSISSPVNDFKPRTVLLEGDVVFQLLIFRRSVIVPVQPLLIEVDEAKQLS